MVHTTTHTSTRGTNRNICAFHNLNQHRATIFIAYRCSHMSVPYILQSCSVERIYIDYSSVVYRRVNTIIYQTVSSARIQQLYYKAFNKLQKQFCVSAVLAKMPSSRLKSSGDSNGKKLIQLVRDVNRQTIRDQMQLFVTEHSIGTELFNVRKFAKLVENAIFTSSAHELDAIYMFKLNAVLMHIRGQDVLHKIVRKIISAKKLVSMTTVFSCIKCGKKAKQYSVFCSSDCIRRDGNFECNEMGVRFKRNAKRNTVECQFSKSKPKKIPAYLNPVVRLRNLSATEIARKIAESHKQKLSNNVKRERHSVHRNRSIDANLIVEIPLETLEINLPSTSGIIPIKKEFTIPLKEIRSPTRKLRGRSNTIIELDRPQQKSNVKQTKTVAERQMPELTLAKPKAISARRKTMVETNVIESDPINEPNESHDKRAKPIKKRRQTMLDANANKSKPVKERRKSVHKNVIDATEKLAQPIKQQRPTVVDDNRPELIKEPRQSIVDPKKPKKLASRRKSLHDLCKSMKTKQHRQNSMLPNKMDQREIFELREQTRCLLYQKIQKRTNEQSLMMPFSTDQLLTKDEIVKYADNVEQEMFSTFGCDHKYKKKYRELVFNITDRNNDILFLSISRQLITPEELVRMTVYELASAERTEEREILGRHSIDMLIQVAKDNLARPPIFMMKSHRGEEIIDGDHVQPIQLDTDVEPCNVITELNAKTGVDLGDMPYRPARILPRRMSLNPVFQLND